jgi:hypothetical protein
MDQAQKMIDDARKLPMQPPEFFTDMDQAQARLDRQRSHINSVRDYLIEHSK